MCLQAVSITFIVINAIGRLKSGRKLDLKDQCSSKQAYESLPNLARNVHKLLVKADPFPVTSATLVDVFNRPPSKIWGTESWPGDHIDLERHRRQVHFAQSSAKGRAFTDQQEAYPTGAPTDPRLSKKQCPSLLGAKTNHDGQQV